MDKKNVKYLVFFLNIVIVLAICIYIIIKDYNYIKTIENIKRDEIEYEDFFKEVDKKISDELNYYNLSFENFNNAENYKNPYLPNGFTHVEGDYKEGYVVEDIDGNQYVWIPCTNNEQDNNATIFQKKDFVPKALVKSEDCYDEEYKSFFDSVAQNGGFYVSRFEIGIENEKYVSKENKDVLQNLNQEEATNLAKNMYNDKFNCNLINGYAYDTVLNWLQKTNEIELFNIDIANNLKTGRNKYNNIYDFTDNILEITSENHVDTVVVRGFSSITDDSFSNNSWQLENRYVIIKDARDISPTNDILGIRTIIYK